MNATRLPKLIIVVSLILVAIFTYQVIQNTVSASVNSVASQPASFGDLQCYEGQQSLPNLGRASQYVGFGDLQYFEAQQLGQGVAQQPSP